MEELRAMMLQWGGPMLFLLLVWNGIVFALYAFDKYRARRGMWRIPEKSLLVCTFLAGGLGGCVGMLVLRHKIRTLRFKVLVPLALLLQGGASAGMVWWLFF